jgi:hypothetical protein
MPLTAHAAQSLHRQQGCGDECGGDEDGAGPADDGLLTRLPLAQVLNVQKPAMCGHTRLREFECAL